MKEKMQLKGVKMPRWMILKIESKAKKTGIDNFSSIVRLAIYNFLKGEK
jgi:predicted DNA-binding ribbon-helix-helix protein